MKRDFVWEIRVLRRVIGDDVDGCGESSDDGSGLDDRLALSLFSSIESSTQQ